MSSANMQVAIAGLESVAGKDSFTAAVNDFMAGNCEKFGIDEQSNLVHQEYKALVEKHLQTHFANQDFDLTEIMATIPACIEAEQEQAYASPAMLDMLQNYSDFETFRESMLLARRDFEWDIQTNLPPKVMAAGTPGWRRVVDKQWILVDRYTLVLSADYLRTSVILDLPLSDMIKMVSPSANLQSWMPMVTELTVGEPLDNNPDDRLVEMAFKVPLMPSCKVGGRWRLIRKYPDEDACTVLFTPDGRCQGMQSSATCICRSIEGDADKSQLTMIEEVPATWIPSFLVDFLAASVYPRLLLSMAAKYTKYKQQMPPGAMGGA
eukprot:TRINITY_DN43933_c0_g1_i1.p1 TRINITY_DN43933_c0_g1~~TRINITY_DN43933_c0_g1_i1.p1  ORF type:complete len:322 (-),score=72.39 TRINITY_DN43933_c0_g1_i1:409-1374(-)